VRPMSSGCACGTERHDATRPIAHPGGWYVLCLECRREWIEWALREAAAIVARLPLPHEVIDERVCLREAILVPELS
jgi:hypothetical protein